MIQDAKANEEEDKKAEAKITAKNGLESYIYQTTSQIGDADKLGSKLSEGDKTTIQDALKEAQDWLSSNPDAEREEYEEQQKKLESICNPIISQAYGSQGGSNAEYENPDDL